MVGLRYERLFGVVKRINPENLHVTRIVASQRESREAKERAKLGLARIV